MWDSGDRVSNSTKAIPSFSVILVSTPSDHQKIVIVTGCSRYRCYRFTVQLAAVHNQEGVPQGRACTMTLPHNLFLSTVAEYQISDYSLLRDAARPLRPSSRMPRTSVIYSLSPRFICLSRSARSSNSSYGRPVVVPSVLFNSQSEKPNASVNPTRSGKMAKVRSSIACLRGRRELGGMIWCSSRSARACSRAYKFHYTAPLSC